MVTTTTIPNLEQRHIIKDAMREAAAANHDVPKVLRQYGVMFNSSIRHAYDFTVKNASPEDTGLGLAATDNTDLPGDWLADVYRFDARKNLDMTRYRKNPILLIDHSTTVLSIVGWADRLEWVKAGLELTPGFYRYALADTIRQMWADSAIRALSISHSPDPRETKYYVEDDLLVVEFGNSELVEISFVYAGRDPDALKNGFASINESVLAEVELAATVRKVRRSLE